MKVPCGGGKTRRGEVHSSAEEVALSEVTLQAKRVPAFRVSHSVVILVWGGRWELLRVAKAIP